MRSTVGSAVILRQVVGNDAPRHFVGYVDMALWTQSVTLLERSDAKYYLAGAVFPGKDVAPTMAAEAAHLVRS